MSRFILLSVFVLHALSAVAAEPPAKVTGILVFDNCDSQYQGKEEYKDNLTLLDSAGELSFRVSGFNNAESIGSGRMIATDSTRSCIWVIENAGHRIRQFDFAGKETLSIRGVKGSAIAVDPETGNLWALVGEHLGKGKTVVYDFKGKEVKSLDIPGWDIAYDRKTKAFWIADNKLTKVSAAKGETVFSCEVSAWCSSSLDIDSRDGSVWVAVRRHPQVMGSSNRLFKFDAAGKGLAAIDFGEKFPFRVSVDQKDGNVWVALMRSSVKRFSAAGDAEAEFPVEALSVQVDPAGSDVWVVTSTETQRMTPRGEVTKRVKHAGKTTQAWIAPLE